MQHVEAAIGEADAQALRAPLRQARVEIARCRSTIFSSAASSAAAGSARATRRRRRPPCRSCRPRPRRAALAARSAASQSALAGEHHRQHRGHGIAGAGHVAHLAPNRPARGPARRRAAPASCPPRSASPGPPRFRPAAIASARRRGDRRHRLSTRHARRLGQFLAVRRDDGRAAIDREISALGIDDHGLAERFRAARSPARITRGVSTPLA